MAVAEVIVQRSHAFELSDAGERSFGTSVRLTSLPVTPPSSAHLPTMAFRSHLWEAGSTLKPNISSTSFSWLGKNRSRSAQAGRISCRVRIQSSKQHARASVQELHRRDKIGILLAPE